VDVILASPPGRALQMNCGAERAQGGVLLFLHADTLLPSIVDFLQLIRDTPVVWGFFFPKLKW